MPYPTTINSQLGGNFGLKAWKIECVNFQNYTFMGYYTEDCSGTGVLMTSLVTAYNSLSNFTQILAPQLLAHTCAYGPQSNHCPYFCLQYIDDEKHNHTCTYSYDVYKHSPKKKLQTTQGFVTNTFLLVF